MNTLPAVISKPDLPALAEAIKAAHQTVLRAGESMIRATGECWSPPGSRAKS